MDADVAGNLVVADVEGNPAIAEATEELYSTFVSAVAAQSHVNDLPNDKYNIAPDFIPLPEISSQFETNNVPSPQFIPYNTNMDYNANQTASNTQ